MLGGIVISQIAVWGRRTGLLVLGLLATAIIGRAKENTLRQRDDEATWIVRTAKATGQLHVAAAAPVVL